MKTLLKLKAIPITLKSQAQQSASAIFYVISKANGEDAKPKPSDQITRHDMIFWYNQAKSKNILDKERSYINRYLKIE